MNAGKLLTTMGVKSENAVLVADVVRGRTRIEDASGVLTEDGCELVSTADQACNRSPSLIDKRVDVEEHEIDG